MANYHNVDVVYCVDCRFCVNKQCTHPDDRNPYGCIPFDFCDCGELPPELPVIDIEEIQNSQS